MAGLISYYASLICPLSPLGRSIIIAVVVVLALLHIRILYVVEAWLRRPDLGLSRGFALATLAAAHIDVAIVAGFAAFHAAAESTCPVPGGGLRLALPLAAAGAMAMFAWILFFPHVTGKKTE